MLGLIVLLIIALIVFGIIHSVRAQGKKLEEERVAARIDTEETYERIKKAIAEDRDIYSLDGFRAFEDSDWIKNYTAYPKFIKPMCVELVRHGYDFGQYISETSPGYWIHEVKREYEASILIAKGKEEQGSIHIYGTHRYESFIHYRHIQHYKDYYKHRVPHMIMHDDFLFCFEARACLPMPTPEWLMICASFIKAHIVEFKDPEWLSECPEAKEYVNSMF